MSRRSERRFVAVEKNISPYWDRVNAGLQKGAAQLGLAHDVLAPPDEDLDHQLELVARAIDDGVDGIAVVATQEEAFDDLIWRARDRGIGVITFDLDAPRSARSLYVGTTTPVELGRIAGRAMLRTLAPGTVVVAQTGSTLAAGAVGKIEGLREVLADHRVDVIVGPPDDGDVTQAREIARELMMSRDDIGGAYGVYAYHAGIQAEVLGELDRTDVTIIGNDMSTQTVAGLRTGAISCSIWIQEYYFGYYAAAAMGTILAHGTDQALTLLGMDQLAQPARRLALPVIEYTTATVADYIAWERDVLTGSNLP